MPAESQPIPSRQARALDAAHGSVSGFTVSYIPEGADSPKQERCSSAAAFETALGHQMNWAAILFDTRLRQPDAYSNYIGVSEDLAPAYAATALLFEYVAPDCTVAMLPAGLITPSCSEEIKSSGVVILYDGEGIVKQADVIGEHASYKFVVHPNGTLLHQGPLPAHIEKKYEGQFRASAFNAAFSTVRPHLTSDFCNTTEGWQKTADLISRNRLELCCNGLNLTQHTGNVNVHELINISSDASSFHALYKEKARQFGQLVSLWSYRLKELGFDISFTAAPNESSVRSFYELAADEWVESRIEKAIESWEQGRDFYGELGEVLDEALSKSDHVHVSSRNSSSGKEENRGYMLYTKNTDSALAAHFSNCATDSLGFWFSNDSSCIWGRCALMFVERELPPLNGLRLFRGGF